MPTRRDTQTEEKPNPEGRQGKGRPWTAEEQREASRKGVAARKEKQQARTDRAEENALTFRQRLGVSLSKLTQSELDKRVKEARPTELVRFADQAFGKPMPAEGDEPKDAELAELSREQRASLRAFLEGDEPSASDAGDTPTPASDEPHARESLGGTTESE